VKGSLESGFVGKMLNGQIGEVLPKGIGYFSLIIDYVCFVKLPSSLLVSGVLM
jgi:hypothetical protein